MYAHVYVINVPVRSISGTHSISEEDLGLPSGTLPPDELATMGNLIVVDKKLLAPIEKLRAKTKRLLASKGVKAGLGTVVTAADLNGLTDELKTIQSDFYDAKAALLASFDSELQKRVQEHPEYAALIERYAPDVNYIERRLSYHIDTYRFEVSSDDPHADLLSSTLNREGNDISSNLVREIAAFVQQVHEASIQKTGKITKANLGPLNRTLLPKIKSFQLLDRSLAPVGVILEALISDIDAFITAKPKGAAYVDGVDLVPFEQRLNRLRSADSIKSLRTVSLGTNTTLGTVQPIEQKVPSDVPSVPGSLPKRPMNDPVGTPPAAAKQKRAVHF